MRDPQRSKRQRADRYQRRRARGLCADCPAAAPINPDNGRAYWRCRPCRIRQSARVCRRWAERKQQREAAARA